MIGSARDDPDFDPVFRVPAGKPIKDVDVLPRVEIVDCPFAVDLKGVLTERISTRHIGDGALLTPS